MAALSLPERIPAIVCLAMAVASAVMLFRGRPAAAAFFLAFTLAGFVLGAGLDDRLPTGLDGSVVEITGIVDDLPREETRRRVLTVRIEAPPGLPRRARLAWYEPEGQALPRPGERWRFVARLRVPRGLANPGGMDWEGWLLRAGIGATGYVSGPQGGRRVDGHGDRFLAFRGRLAERVRQAAGAGPSGGVVVAITSGLGGAVAPELRETLSRTGTGHLLAISGLHVGLAAALGGMAAGLAAGAGRRRGPAAGWGAAAAAAGYSVLAGAPVSARRAVLMLVAGLAAVVLRRQPGALPVLALAWVLVTGSAPLSPMDPGLWMSFGAVSAIAWVMAARLGTPGRVTAVLRMQAVLSLAMVCLTGPWFGRVSLVSPLANLLAVPWFTVIVIPAALAGACLLAVAPPLGQGLLSLAGGATEVAIPVLEALGTPEWAAWPVPECSGLSIACAVAGVGWLSAPRPAPARPLALCLLAPLFLGPPADLRAGEFRLHVLDVGQGLATVLRTAGTTTVYDAGPSWPGGDAGMSTVVPALRALGVRRLDALVLSHGDSDHAGGGEAVIAALSPRRVFAGQGAERAGAVPCSAGMRWSADGVSFRFLAPGGRAYPGRNDGSCVLLVEGPGGRVLLTGDIERAGEAGLLRRGGSLIADVVVAPHHGSRSSSGRGLVAGTRPAWVVFAAGWRNRWGFPHPEVVHRWRDRGALPVATDREGALEFTFGRAGPVPPSGRRAGTCRPWRDCGRVAGP